MLVRNPDWLGDATHEPTQCALTGKDTRGRHHARVSLTSDQFYYVNSSDWHLWNEDKHNDLLLWAALEDEDGE
jgi:hypothetical protein